MVSFKTSFFILLLFPLSALAQTNYTSPPPSGATCRPIGSGGTSISTDIGRKVALVIDSSGSNAQTDPKYLRVVAAKAINSLLVTSAAASADPSLKADLVTVVDFDSYAEVTYPLGDPSGASSKLDLINANGNTNIASGVKSAIDEITKATDVATKSGIVVFTDGQDSSETALITQLVRAKDAGIRVSFGFLLPPTGTKPTTSNNILNAIIATGGTYAAINNDAAQQSFVSLVASNGLTGLDAAVGGITGPAPLFNGLSAAGVISGAAKKEYTYTAGSGEILSFTITSQSNQKLKSVLNTVPPLEATTDVKGVASLSYTTTSGIDLILTIEAISNGTSEGIFTVGLNSSAPVLPFCNDTTPGTGGKNGSSTTKTGGPTVSLPTASVPTQNGLPPISNGVAAGMKAGGTVIGIVVAVIIAVL